MVKTSKFFFESFPQNPVVLSVMFCKKFGIFSPGDKVGVGVSGGKDSIFLLHILTFFRSKFGIKDVLCLHFNHGTRGKESDKDEEFVKKFCEDIGVKFIGEKTRIELKTEDEMRKVRYDFFSKSAKEFKLDKIATAHNLDDLFETFLINLKRGGGFMSAIGIYPININLCAVPVVRPIICVKRKSIEKYIKENRLSYVEDSSNLDIKILRNRIRMTLSLLPDEIYDSILLGFFKFWLNLYATSDFLSDTYNKNPEILPEVIKKQIEIYKKFGNVEYEILKRNIKRKEN